MHKYQPQRNIHIQPDRMGGFSVLINGRNELMTADGLRGTHISFPMYEASPSNVSVKDAHVKISFNQLPYGSTRIAPLEAHTQQHSQQNPFHRSIPSILDALRAVPYRDPKLLISCPSDMGETGCGILRREIMTYIQLLEHDIKAVVMVIAPSAGPPRPPNKELLDLLNILPNMLAINSDNRACVLAFVGSWGAHSSKVLNTITECIKGARVNPTLKIFSNPVSEPSGTNNFNQYPSDDLNHIPRPPPSLAPPMNFMFNRAQSPRLSNQEEQGTQSVRRHVRDRLVREEPHLQFLRNSQPPKYTLTSEKKKKKKKNNNNNNNNNTNNNKPLLSRTIKG
jgi:hypothetical protein